MDMEPDVAIVGAGPAGASAAIRLAQAGRRVLLVDRKTFPREKACGGCLSGRTVGRLHALLGDKQPLPGVPGTQVTFVVGNYRLTCQAGGRTRVVHRADLDARLVEDALAAGAAGMFGEAASLQLPEKPLPRSGGCGGRLKVGENTIQAGVILIASGVGGLAGKVGGVDQHEAERRTPGAAKRARPRMLAQQWVQPGRPGLPETGQVTLHWLRGGYVGLASPREGDCVVALAARLGEDAGESAFERLRRLNPNSPLWDLLPPDAPRSHGARGAAGFPWRPKRLGLGNILLIGDAAGYEEPYTGEGIGLALLSAECATNAILAGGDILGRYGGLMRRHHRPVVRRTWWISRILQSSLLGRLASKRPVLPAALLARLVDRVHVRGAT